MKELALTINGNPVTAPGGIPTGGFGDQGVNLIQVVTILLSTLGAVLAISFIIYAGIQWSMSGGDKQKVQAARNRLIYSIVGLIVITLAFFIVNIITKLITGV